jgi:hypothetical protein
MSETNKPSPVKHINAKIAGVDPRDAVRTEAPVYMVRIFGIVQGVKMFEDRRSGDSKTVFIGEFVAVGPDGSQYTSDKMFAFKALEEKLASGYKSSGEQAVEFGYDITSLPDEKSATGYVYRAESIIATQTSDRLAAMTKAVSQIPSPAAPATTEAAKPGAVAAGVETGGNKKGK